MKERNFYSQITRYYLANATASIAWEAKMTRTSRLPFSCLAPHQEQALLQAERVYGEKIADTGILKKGFDGFILYKATSLLIAVYYSPRHTEIYEIPIRAFLREKYEGSEKSLSKDRAGEIGRRVKLSTVSA